jgi:hypothetical protein
MTTIQILLVIGATIANALFTYGYVNIKLREQRAETDHYLNMYAEAIRKLQPPKT